LPGRTSVMSPYPYTPPQMESAAVILLMRYVYLQYLLSHQTASDLIRFPLSPMCAQMAIIDQSSQFLCLILSEICIRYDLITYKNFHLSLDLRKYFPHSTHQINRK
jgi:hypothetical protein